MTGTALFAFKRAFRANLAARPALSEVDVLYGATDLGEAPGWRAIWFGDAAARGAARAGGDVDIPVMRSGRKTVHERVTLTVVLQVLLEDGQLQEEADTELEALYAEVESELAETPQQTSEILWAQIEGYTHVVGFIPARDGSEIGHGSRAEVDVTYEARVTAS